MLHLTVSQSGTGKVGEIYVGNTQVPIQEALTYLEGNGGGKLYVEAGDYDIKVPINVPSNVDIYGDYNLTRLIPSFASSGDNAVFSVVGTTDNPKLNVKIRNFFIGSETTAKKGNIGILTKYCGSNKEQGILVEGNTCSGNTSSGINLQSSSNNTVTGNTCTGNSSSGIYLVSSSNNSITGNTCTGNSTGINLTGSSNNNTITGNICSGNSSYGILLNSSSNNTVTGNTCTGNSSYGISLVSSSNNTVTGNTCMGNSIGISLSSSGNNNNTVTGNTCNSINNGGSGNTITPNIAVK